MLSNEKVRDQAIAFWETQRTDDPFTVNGFAGKWQISEHSLIPNSLNNFLAEYFYDAVRISRVPIEDINKVLNEVWEGPGSMAKIESLTYELRTNRQHTNTKRAVDVLKNYDTPTIDSNLDDDDEDFDDE